MKLVTAEKLNRLWEKGILPRLEGLKMPDVDQTLSDTSENPVQNKAVTKELGKKAEGEGLKFSVVGGILTVTYQE